MNLETFTIDRGLNIPIAEQIANRLQKDILSGKLDPGEKLPPERDLALHLGVSRGTVKRAYARLAQSEAIDIRQGSGSYVLKNGHVLEQNQKEDAIKAIASTFARLRDMGLSEREILNLVNLHYLNVSSGGAIRKITIMVVSNNHQILSELEQQLSYLTDSSPFLFTLSFLTLDTVAGSPDPVQMLLGYDLIIATSIDHPEMLRIAPMFRGKILEAALSPRTRTLKRLSGLPPESRFMVIYRTEIFRDMVVRCLVSLDFRRDHIHTCPDRDYDPETHSQNGVNVLLNFNESPIYTAERFQERNARFEAEGGRIMRFEYQIERGSLVYIEDQIQRLIRQVQEH